MFRQYFAEVVSLFEVASQSNSNQYLLTTFCFLIILGGKVCATKREQIETFKGQFLCDWENVRCDDISISNTEIKCLTNPQSYSSGSVQVQVPGFGYAITNEKFL